MNADQTKQHARIAKDAKAPRLVLRFAVLTAIGLGLAAATIVLAVRQSSTTHSQRHAVEHTRVATKAVLEPELRSTDLTRRSSTKRRRELDRLFEERVLLEGIREVTLYDAAGRVMYSTSTETRAVDRRAPTDRLLEALRGFVISDVHASRDGAQRWLRTYVPLTVVLLFAVFAPVLMRVTSRLRRHVAEVQHVATHDEVTGAPNRLGFRQAVEAKHRGCRPRCSCSTWRTSPRSTKPSVRTVATRCSQRLRTVFGVTSPTATSSRDWARTSSAFCLPAPTPKQ